MLRCCADAFSCRGYVVEGRKRKADWADGKWEMGRYLGYVPFLRKNGRLGARFPTTILIQVSVSCLGFNLGAAPDSS